MNFLLYSFLNERKFFFICVYVYVVVFNMFLIEDILVELNVIIVWSLCIEIQLELENFVFGLVGGESVFENVIKRLQFLIVFELLFCCYFCVILWKVLFCNQDVRIF